MRTKLTDTIGMNEIYGSDPVKLSSHDREKMLEAQTKINEQETKNIIPFEHVKLKDDEVASLLLSRKIVIWIVIVYLFFSGGLLSFLVFLKSDYLFKTDNWHVPLALVVGCFVSMFGTMALLLRGVFKQNLKESVDALTPETFKLFFDLAKSIKSGD